MKNIKTTVNKQGKELVKLEVFPITIERKSHKGFLSNIVIILGYSH